jgi:hypothetical protein
MLRRLAHMRVSRQKILLDPRPITGWLGLLPPELIDAICAALLGFPAKSAQDYINFMFTCRGIYASIGDEAVLEARCLMTIDCVISDKYLQQGPYGHTEYAKLCIRSRMEQDLLKTCMKEWVVLHCANPTSECCRAQRVDLNWRCRDVPLKKSFLQDSLATLLMDEHGSSLNVGVVAAAGSSILCATPDGVLMSDTDRVWGVTSEANPEFKPGYEFETTFCVERCSNDDVWAAAEGTRIAVCHLMASEPSGTYTKYKLRIFDDGHEHATMDVAHYFEHHGDDPGDERRYPLLLERMWIHKGSVWLLFLKGGSSNTTWMRLVRVSQRANGGEWAQTRTETLNLEHVKSTSVATVAGHVAIMDNVVTRLGPNVSSYARVHFFDVDSRKFGRVDSDGAWCASVEATPQTAGPNHRIALSPDGTVMVMMNRSLHTPSLNLFLRHKDRTLSMGWTLCYTGLDVSLRNSMVRSPITDAVFSPCGRKFYAFFIATTGSPGGVLEIDTSYGCWGLSHFDNVQPYRMPSKAVWSTNDGLFVQTATAPVGVLRLGLVEWSSS